MTNLDCDVCEGLQHEIADLNVELNHAWNTVTALVKMIDAVGGYSTPEDQATLRAARRLVADE